MKTKHSSKHACPDCDTKLHRIKKTKLQRLLSRIVPFKRFYCYVCHKKFLRR